MTVRRRMAETRRSRGSHDGPSRGGGRKLLLLVRKAGGRTQRGDIRRRPGARRRAQRLLRAAKGRGGKGGDQLKSEEEATGGSDARQGTEGTGRGQAKPSWRRLGVENHETRGGVELRRCSRLVGLAAHVSRSGGSAAQRPRQPKRRRKGDLRPLLPKSRVRAAPINPHTEPRQNRTSPTKPAA